MCLLTFLALYNVGSKYTKKNKLNVYANDKDQLKAEQKKISEQDKYILETEQKNNSSFTLKDLRKRQKDQEKVEEKAENSKKGLIEWNNDLDRKIFVINLKKEYDKIRQYGGISQKYGNLVNITFITKILGDDLVKKLKNIKNNSNSQLTIQKCVERYYRTTKKGKKVVEILKKYPDNKGKSTSQIIRVRSKEVID